MKSMTPSNGSSVSELAAERGSREQTQLESRIRASFQNSMPHRLSSDLASSIIVHPKRGSCVLAYVLSVMPTRSALPSAYRQRNEQ